MTSQRFCLYDVRKIDMRTNTNTGKHTHIFCSKYGIPEVTRTSGSYADTEKDRRVHSGG